MRLQKMSWGKKMSDAIRDLVHQINALLDKLYELEEQEIGTDVPHMSDVAKWELPYASGEHRRLTLTHEQCEQYEWCAEQLFAAGLIPEATVSALAAYALDKIQGLIGEHIAMSLLRGNKHTLRFASDEWKMATYGEEDEQRRDV